ncbi:hypothetical protein MW332_003092 [Vibrio parahaemolyticus]|nr:hypothetical protein [Vibrio parahaemolyticus]
MLDRVLIALGVPLFLIGIPLLIIHAMKPVLSSFLYYPEVIELTFVFSMVPFLSWFWILGMLGFFCILFNIKPKWSKSWNKYLGAYVPCFLVFMGVCIGTIGKVLIKNHLVNHGYVLEKTEKLRTSFYIPYDKDIYVMAIK